MAQNNTSTTQSDSQSVQSKQPDPALKRLEKLVGTWDLKGRTPDSDKDNIFGRVVIEWMPGGFFMKQEGEMQSGNFKIQSLEILYYDPLTDNFPSLVYSSMDGVPSPYKWDVQGDQVTHWTDGAKYTGTFSKDGNVLEGGWRPDEGIEENAGNTYDATMTRVK